VKFDEGSEFVDLTYSFDSNRLPMWGDIEVQGPRQQTLRNAEFGNRSSEGGESTGKKSTDPMQESALLLLQSKQPKRFS